MIGVLPKTLEIDGEQYAIRSDFRVALMIFQAYNNPDLTPVEKWLICINCLFAETPKDLAAALEKAMWFLDGGDAPKAKAAPAKLFDWEQDESLIFPAINKTAGYETRERDYLHWWTFLGFFNEMGEGLYSQVMNIRQKRAKGKRLEKWEQEFFNSHKEMIILREKLTAAEQKEFDEEEAFIDSLC